MKLLKIYNNKTMNRKEKIKETANKMNKNLTLIKRLQIMLKTSLKTI
mgnify:CR=1 FL=1